MPSSAPSVAGGRAQLTAAHDEDVCDAGLGDMPAAIQQQRLVGAALARLELGEHAVQVVQALHARVEHVRRRAPQARRSRGRVQPQLLGREDRDAVHEAEHPRAADSWSDRRRARRRRASRSAARRRRRVPWARTVSSTMLRIASTPPGSSSAIARAEAAKRARWSSSRKIRRPKTRIPSKTPSP